MKTSLKCILILLFFLSSSTGLGYEVLWSRWLITIFGSSSWAISTILTSFMLGLALGSYIASKLKKISSYNQFMLYGFAEASIGIYSFFFPLLINLINYLQGHYAFPWISHYFFYNLLRFFLSLSILLIPTTLMGATLPFLVGYISNRAENDKKWSGFLYGVNTLGAFIGTFLSGFFLIPSLGLIRTNLLFVVINLLVAFVSLLYIKLIEKNLKIVPEYQILSSPQNNNIVYSKFYKVILLIFFFNGLFNLGYEVLWTRSLNLIIGTTTYAFTIMLSIFLSGIAIGSLSISKLLDKIKNKLLLFIIFQFLITLCVMISPFLINQSPYLYLIILHNLGMSWISSIIIKIILCIILIFPLTFLMGAVFPLGFDLAYTNREKLRAEVGSLYSINTAGGIIGSFLAGFFFIPIAGIELSLKLTSLLHLIIVIVLLLSNKFSKEPILQYKKAFSVSLLIIIFLSILGNWDKRITASGVYFQPELFISPKGEIHLKDKMNKVSILFHSEGVSATVDVLKSPGGYQALTIDGKPVATSNFYDKRVQLMLGILPLLLHPNPENILIIGLGTGMTSGTSSIDKNSKDIKIIEINKEVVKASYQFRNWNLDVLRKKNVSLLIEDALHFIKYSDNKYDIITSDPIHPFVAGSGNLYSIEHYSISYEKLKENGIFCQWVPLYQLNAIDIKTILKTFYTAFPNATFWVTGTNFILCGSKGTLKLSINKLYEKASDRNYRKILNALGFWIPEELFMAYAGELSDLKNYFKDAPINSINYPFLEFSCPKAIFNKTVASNLKDILASIYYNIPSFIAFDNSDAVARFNYLIPCIEIIKEAFIAEQSGNIALASKILRQAYNQCPYSGYVRHFAAHIILTGIDEIQEKDLQKAYNFLLIAKKLDPFNAEIDKKLAKIESVMRGKQ